MRGVIPAICALLLLGLAFGVYLTMQTPTGGDRAEGARPRRAATAPGGAAQGVSGAVDGVWMDHYDPATGQRTSRIRAQRYEPMKDGRVKVLAPELEYFLRDGQVMRLASQWGVVTMQEGINRARNIPAGARVNQTPRYGEFRNVVLTLRPTADEPRPTLTLTMPSASFDHESFLISTAALSDDDGVLAADQVPVTVRGDDYEFDGRGLVIQYNQLSRRLEYLKVFHGQRLLIKHPGVHLGGAATTRPARSGSAGGVGPSPRAALPGPIGGPIAALEPALAAAVEKQPAARRRPAEAAPSLPASRPAAGRSGEPAVYRATFEQSVQVFQGDRLVASADRMQIDFMEGAGGDTSASTRPAATAPRAAGHPSGASGGVRSASATRPGGAAPATRAVRPAAMVARSAAEAEQPVLVRWTGPLTIVAVPGEPPGGLVAGHAVVRLESAAGGRPVEVTHHAPEGRTTLRCGRLSFRTADRGAVLEGGQGDAVSMTDWRGTSITARSMRFSGEGGTAELRGPGVAVVPPEDPKAGEAGGMRLKWADLCLLRFDEDSGDSFLVKSAELAGDVSIHHPQLDMRAARMDLDFDAAPSQASGRRGAPPAVRELRARGGVRCDMADAADPSQRRTLSCDDLRLLTAKAADGSMYVRSLVATGNVAAQDAQRKLAAGYLSVALAAPAADAAGGGSRGAMRPGDVASMVAHDAVKITGADGATAAGDSLAIRADGPRKEVTLSGRPAVVRRGDDVLEGPIVRLVPEDEGQGVTGEIGIQGAGRIRAMQRSGNDEPPRRVELSWSQTLSGDMGLLTCVGDVKATAVEPDGTVNTAVGHQAVISTTRPAVAGAPTTKPTPSTQAKPGPAADLPALSGRVIRGIDMEGRPDRPVVVQSTLESPAGAVLRMFHIETQRISYTHGNERQRSLRIPGAGRMLLLDDRPAATQPAARQAAADPLALRGKTGFTWEKHLAYDGERGTLEMAGQVKIARVEQDGRLDDPLRVDADRVVVELEDESPPVESRPPGGAAQPQAETSARVHVKKVTASGEPIRIWSSRLNLEAVEIEHDPALHRLRAAGTARRPVRKYDRHGLEEASFDELIINTETFDIVSAKNMVLKHRAPGKQADRTE